MIKIFNTKLTKRYFIVALAIIFSSLLIVWVLADHFSKNALRQEITKRNYLLNKTLSIRFEQIFTDIEDDFFIYESYFKEQANQQYLIKKRMENIVATKPWYLFIQYFDKNGELNERVPQVVLDKQKLNLKSIVERIQWSRTPYVTDILILPDGRKTIGVATPISKTSEEFEGGFIAFLNLEVLSDFLYQSRLGEEGFCFILNRKGNIIAHSEKKYIGENIEESVLSKYLMKGRYGIWEGEIFNNDAIVSYYPISYDTIGLVVGEPIKQAFKPNTQLSSLLLHYFLLILLISIYLVYLGTSRVVKPIIHLTDQAKRYSRGEILDIEEIDTGDEITVLSKTMHSMACELINKEKSLFQILESIPYAIITTDRDGIIKSFNRGAEELLLFSREEVIGCSIYNLKIFKQGNELLKHTFESNKVIEEAEICVCDKNGEKHDVRFYSASLFNEELYNSGAIIVIRDVSEMKKLQEHLYQSERLAALGQLTAGIAHEIKNPLNIISVASEALQRRQKKNKTKDPYVEDLSKNILDTTNRMNKLLQEFLQLSNEKIGKVEVVDLIHVLDDLLHKLRTTLYEKNIILHRFYSVNHAVIKGDKNRIAQAFLNLILNSIHAMENNGELTIAIEEQNKYWCVSIKDTGVGIKESNLQRIFNPFFSTKQTGTGLGLSIVHEIITQHNGSIAVESKVNIGTTMRCFLPK